MSRKSNTLLFILTATLFNVLAGLLSFALFFVLYVRVVAPRLNDAARPWGLPLILLASFGLSFALYHLAVRQFIRRVNMKKHFSPLFRDRERNSPDRDGQDRSIS